MTTELIEKTATLLEILQSRHSSRGPFDSEKAVTAQQIGSILEAARWAPTPNNMQNFQIIVVDDAAKLEAIGEIPADMSEAYLRENYALLSNTEEELRTRKTGMLATNYPKAWIDPEAWNPGSDSRSQLTSLGKVVLQPQVLMLVLYDSSRRAPGSAGDILGFMGLGCVMENMWLMSQTLGLGMHVLTVFSDSRVDEQVHHLLGIAPPMKVGFACSLGYPADPAQSYVRVRRNLADFVHHNHFGEKDVPWSSTLEKPYE